MGNQTSQWFALYYLDGMDRLVKEKHRIRHYTRYMDCILVHPDKMILKSVMKDMSSMLAELGLEFNDKTQIFPISAGVEYLGWGFTLTETGSVIRRLKKHSKIRWRHRLRKLMDDYAEESVQFDKIKESLQSYRNHLSYGNTYSLYSKTMRDAVFIKPGRMPVDTD